MRTIAQTENVTLKVQTKEILSEEWIPFQLVSLKLKEIEKQQSKEYKSLRVKFYNSSACGKYNESTFAGLKCINVKNPMKDGVSASLCLTFEEAEGE